MYFAILDRCLLGFDLPEERLRISSFLGSDTLLEPKAKHSQMAAELSSALLLKWKKCSFLYFLFDLPRKSG